MEEGCITASTTSPILVPPDRDINHAYLAAVNVTRTFSPSLVLTVSYGFNRWSEREGGSASLYPSINPVTTLGLPDYMNISGFPTSPPSP